VVAEKKKKEKEKRAHRERRACRLGSLRKLRLLLGYSRR